MIYVKYYSKKNLISDSDLVWCINHYFGLKTFTPGDPARQILGNSASEAQVQEKREELGLNDPVPVQYLIM